LIVLDRTGWACKTWLKVCIIVVAICLDYGASVVRPAERGSSMGSDERMSRVRRNVNTMANGLATPLGTKAPATRSILTKKCPHRRREGTKEHAFDHAAKEAPA